jgi:hypothetical protein
MKETHEARASARSSKGGMNSGDPRRRLYATNEMTRLIAPRSVAVVGVSERPNAFGSRTVGNMKLFDGRLYHTRDIPSSRGALAIQTYAPCRRRRIAL